MGTVYSKQSEAKEINYELHKYMTMVTMSVAHKDVRKMEEVALGYGIQRKVLVIYFSPDGLFLQEPASYYKRYYHNPTLILHQETDQIQDPKFCHFSKLEDDLKNKLKTFKR